MKKTDMLFIASVFAVATIAIWPSVSQANGKQKKHALSAKDRIRPYEKNPRYWQYKGKPVLLLGGSKRDSLFQIPDLEEHLDLLASVGGNYIRNTMSDRKDRGYEVYPYKRLPNGKYDLTQWNEEYWRRFGTMLKLTHQRDIIVQIEVWDRFDHSWRNWGAGPYRPANNVNYTGEETGLADAYPKHPSRDKQPFFHTIPGMPGYEKRYDTIRQYQERFVEKLLSYTLDYGNVLYCMDNETSTPVEWGQYWMQFIRDRAKTRGVLVFVTDMFDEGWDLDTHSAYLTAFDLPGSYTFLDISQNNANKNTVEKHWQNILLVYDRTKNHPRPINNVKVYGADEYPPRSNYQKRVYRRWGTQSGIRSFVMNVLGGCASTRFHRNESNGIGLTEPARNCIKAIRKLESLIAVWEVNPGDSSLSAHNAAGVFLAAKPGERYAIYFVDGGSAVWNPPGDRSSYKLKWISVDTGQWGKEDSIPTGRRATVSAPGKGGWIAAIVKQ